MHELKIQSKNKLMKVAFTLSDVLERYVFVLFSGAYLTKDT